MPTVLNATVREYGSGEIVEPGVYMDVDTGAVVEVYERDELPQEVRLVRYPRRFRRVDALPPKAHN